MLGEDRRWEQAVGRLAFLDHARTHPHSEASEGNRTEGWERKDCAWVVGFPIDHLDLDLNTIS